MGIDFDLSSEEIYTTKAEVNYDSLTGTFYIPTQSSNTSEPQKFSFVLDETGIVFIDEGEEALRLVRRIQH